MDLDYNGTIRDYIDRVCAQVRFKDVHNDLEMELTAHIREAAKEYMDKGFSKGEAVEKAVVRMGDPVTVGKELDRAHRPRIEWLVLLFSFIFIGFGLVAIYFAEKTLTSNFIFKRSLLFSIAAAVLIGILYYFDYRKLEKRSKYIYLGTLVLLTVSVLNGTFANGAPWFKLGPINFNIITMSPLLFSISFAGIFNGWDWGSTREFIKGVVIFFVPLIIILKASSFAIAVVYIASFLVIAAASGIGLRKLLPLTFSVMAVLTSPILLEPYIMSRLLTFINPTGDPMGGGYIYVQLRELFSSSSLLGRGFSFDLRMLPEMHTDFILAFITYTFGWAASIILISLAAAFILHMVKTLKRVKTGYGKLLIYGFTAVLGTEFLWNISMNFGFAPIAGISFPFVSYGGSQLITNAAIIGVILSVHRRKNLSTNPYL
ncbi:MAG: FtsW/RodA/SpoVE family cell cycle protein [Clostridia bacterium]|nr:FtsW/RodA/SpoVE family cell cycle protein [Clostridia bacterium]